MKFLVAAVLLATLAAVGGAQLAPNTPLPTVLVYSFLGLAAVLGLVAVLAVAGLTFWQFILRKGGSDTSWLWFSSEPAGLEQQRKALKKGQEAAARKKL